MTSSSTTGTGTPTTSPSVSQVPQSAPATQSAAAHAIFIKCTGPSASVIVSTQNNSSILFQGTLVKGESRFYDLPNLVATIDPVQNVEVLIHGRLVSKGRTGKQFFTD